MRVIIKFGGIMIPEIDKIKEAVDDIRKITDFEPDVAMVLGSGLGAISDCLTDKTVIPYSEISFMPLSTTTSHAGEMHLGYLGGIKVLLFKGRVHLYEGYSVDEVVRPVRIAYMLGAKKLILTNSAGAINTEYKVGDLVLISDAISSFVPSPIYGKLRTEFGSKLEFPDMTNLYDKNIYAALRDFGASQGVNFKEGIYLQCKGAQYETPAEIRFYRTIGADLVGMSTVVESIAARHAGMRIAAVSVVTNMAAGIDKKELSHEEVGREGAIASSILGKVFVEAMEEIGKL